LPQLTAARLCQCRETDFRKWMIQQRKQEFVQLFYGFLESKMGPENERIYGWYGEEQEREVQ